MLLLLLDLFYSCYQVAIFPARRQFSYAPVYFFKGHFIFPGCQFSHMQLHLGEELGKTHLLMLYLKLPVDSLQLLELKHSAGLSQYLTHRATYSLPAQPDGPLGVNSCYLLTLGEVGSIISLYKYTICHSRCFCSIAAISSSSIESCDNLIECQCNTQIYVKWNEMTAWPLFIHQTCLCMTFWLKLCVWYVCAWAYFKITGCYNQSISKSIVTLISFSGCCLRKCISFECIFLHLPFFLQFKRESFFFLLMTYGCAACTCIC